MRLKTVFYSGADDSASLELTEDGSALTTEQMEAITKLSLIVDGTVTLASDTHPTVFSILADRITLFLGRAGLSAGNHRATLFVFDIDHPNGQGWPPQLLFTVATP